VEFFSLVLFAFLTGLSASVIRACVMGVLTLWALRAGKKASFSRVLLWCVLLMALWNPAYLYFDISFHLSVLATLGVVFGSKVVGFKVEEDFLGLKEAFVMTLFAQLFTTPLVLRSFDYLSLVSPLANVLVAPFLPVLMFLGVLLMIVEYVFPFGLFSWIVVWIIEVLGRAFFGIVEVCSRVDFLVVELEGIDRTLLVGGYFLCFVLGMGLYSYWVES
jgi:competence protein ComEC